MKNNILIFVAIGVGLFFLYQKKQNDPNNPNSPMNDLNNPNSEILNTSPDKLTAVQWGILGKGINAYANQLTSKVSGIQSIINANNNSDTSFLTQPAYTDSTGVYYNNPFSNTGYSEQTTANPDTSPGGLSEQDFIAQALDPNNQGPI